MIGQEEREAVMRVLEKGTLSDYQGNWSDHFYGGEEIRALEAEWAAYFGVKHAIACNSATSGLWMALNAIETGYEIKEDGTYGEWTTEIIEDEIIVTPYSMTCSASIPLHFGAKPVFADIEEDYYCLDPKSVEERITEHTKAIIVVDLFGQPYNADAINEIAERKGREYGHKIYVIEDAAQAIGATYKGRYAGTLGDIGVYSLNRHKHIQAGEGGIVVTNDDNLAMRLRLSMNHAEAVINDVELKSGYSEDLEKMEFKYTQSNPMYRNLIGMNLRMTEIQAAIAREQLKKLSGILEVIRDYAQYFDVKVRPECEHAYYRYAWIGETPIQAQSKMQDEDRLFNAKQHYITPLYQMPLFKSLGYQQDQCPVCERIDENIILAWLKEGD